MCMIFVLQKKSTSSLVLLALGLGVALGCEAQGPARIAVAGKVTFDGQPLDEGQIVFTPQAAGFTAAAPIAGGAYRMAADKGPSAGNYLVRITANRPTGRKVKPSAYSKDQTPQDLMEQYIPARYNDSSELTVQFAGESETAHDFDLKSAAGK